MEVGLVEDLVVAFLKDMDEDPMQAIIVEAPEGTAEVPAGDMEVGPVEAMQLFQVVDIAADLGEDMGEDQGEDLVEGLKEDMAVVQVEDMVVDLKEDMVVDLDTGDNLYQ